MYIYVCVCVYLYVRMHIRNQQETLSRALSYSCTLLFAWVESQQGNSCLSMPLYTQALLVPS